MRTGSHVLLRALCFLYKKRYFFIEATEKNISSRINKVLDNNYVVKVHHVSPKDVSQVNGTVFCTVRNPMDAMVSRAHFYVSSGDCKTFEEAMKIIEDEGWVDSMFSRMMAFVNDQRVHIYPYEEMIEGPELLLKLPFPRNKIINAYERTMGTKEKGHFRKGKSGDWKNYIGHPMIEKYKHLNVEYAEAVIKRGRASMPRLRPILPS